MCIRQLSGVVLAADDVSLYPALLRLLWVGWVTAEWGLSETKRQVRFYSLTPDGRKQLRQEIADYGRVSAAIQGILETA